MRGFVTKTAIKADSTGAVPTSINLLKAGSWNTPWHGDFELTGEDLEEMAVNFNEKGIGLVVEANFRAPINEGHFAEKKAFGWLTRLYVDTVNGTAGLFSDVEWTPSGEQAIRDGEYAYISPEFNPRGYPWEDPEQEFTFVDNVLTGAALTNIPLFKKLKPITASRVPPGKVRASATAEEADKRNQGDAMDVATLRAKEVADLTEEEKTFLTEHQAELTADELTKFGIEAETPAPAPQDEEEPTPAPAPAAEPTKIEASAAVAAVQQENAQLKASIAALEDKIESKEISEFLSARVKAGQIKSGEVAHWTGVIKASRGDARTQLQAGLERLPVDETLGKELGDEGAAATTGAVDELDREVRKVMASAAEGGKRVAYYTAQQQVLEANPALATRVNNETKGE